MLQGMGWRSQRPARQARQLHRQLCQLHPEALLDHCTDTRQGPDLGRASARERASLQTLANSFNCTSNKRRRRPGGSPRSSPRTRSPPARVPNTSPNGATRRPAAPLRPGACCCSIAWPLAGRHRLSNSLNRCCVSIRISNLTIRSPRDAGDVKRVTQLHNSR